MSDTPARVDLNADLGEGFGPWRMGDDAALMAVITSANVACGGHAGDPDVMARAMALALAHGVAIGAHPGFADPQGLVAYVTEQGPLAKVRPDMKIVFSRDVANIDKRLKTTAVILRNLVKIAEGRRAA